MDDASNTSFPVFRTKMFSPFDVVGCLFVFPFLFPCGKAEASSLKHPVLRFAR